MSHEDRERWEKRYRQALADPSEPPSGLRPERPPSAALVAWAADLPTAGRALDLGGGTGRHALWLAARGLDTTLVDVSTTALAAAGAAADERGLTVHAIAADLDVDPIPSGPWDVLVVTFFLHRPLFPQLPGLLAPGGVFFCEHPTRRNLERHTRPGQAYLLEEGELRRLVAGLPVLHYDEGWTLSDRHTARVLARRDP
jgi:tellurite methyltransferase